MKQIDEINIDKFIVRPELDDVGTRAAATCAFNAYKDSLKVLLDEEEEEKGV